jgi:hypothetical protein
MMFRQHLPYFSHYLFVRNIRLIRIQRFLNFGAEPDVISLSGFVAFKFGNDGIKFGHIHTNIRDALRDQTAFMDIADARGEHG